jgi:hypothetical protein
VSPALPVSFQQQQMACHLLHMFLASVTLLSWNFLLGLPFSWLTSPHPLTLSLDATSSRRPSLTPPLLCWLRDLSSVLPGHLPNPRCSFTVICSYVCFLTKLLETRVLSCAQEVLVESVNEWMNSSEMCAVAGYGGLHLRKGFLPSHPLLHFSWLSSLVAILAIADYSDQPGLGWKKKWEKTESKKIPLIYIIIQECCLLLYEYSSCFACHVCFPVCVLCVCMCVCTCVSVGISVYIEETTFFVTFCPPYIIIYILHIDFSVS